MDGLKLKVKTFISTKGVLLDQKVNAFLDEIGWDFMYNIIPFCCYGGSLCVGCMVQYFVQEETNVKSIE